MPLAKTITFSYRKAYFFPSRKVLRFKDVSYVDYTFGSLGRDWGLTQTGFGRQDQLESFKITVVTKADERLPVCAFRGEGERCTGWIGVLLGDDDLIDFSGTQEDESRKFAEYIAGLIGVKIGKPTEFSIQMSVCPKCGRSTSRYKISCLYCGAALNDGLYGESLRS